MDISVYSFLALAREAAGIMPRGGSMLTLTYNAGSRVVPNYNVMGVAKAALEATTRYLAADLGVKNIRVNAISAGPLKTLAASGIGDFRYILKWNEYNAPLRRTVTLAMNGWAEPEPAWWLNLQAHPLCPGLCTKEADLELRLGQVHAHFQCGLRQEEGVGGGAA